jgi:hypothetical protein
MTRTIALVLTSSLMMAAALGAADRINQEGRILGVLPTVSTPTLFNTSAADAVVSAMQIFPTDNAWNEDVSRLPLLGGSSDPTQSNAMIAQIRSDVSVANRQRVVVFQEMNYVLVPDAQPNILIFFNLYPDDSDYNGGTNPNATWPIPSNMPIEGWPSQTGSLNLMQYQMDVNNTGGDRHSIVVQPGIGQTFETWQALLTTNSPAWQASNGCIFNLNSDALRPAGETSGDAAGLSLFPALVRYDEAERGMVEHAMRIVVKTSRKSYIYPATHEAGSTTSTTEPAMGQRLRLKSSFVIPGTWTKEETAIALALKKYGGLVADNGNFFSISICPDDRWPANCFDHLSTGAGSDFCDINNFEVVNSTGPTGGPRSAGAPTANAGTNQTVTLAAGASLTGTVTGSGVTTLWTLYPTPTPPGTVIFADPSSASTTAAFSATGTYTVMLEASDGVHTPAFSTVYITVQPGSNPAPTLTSISPTTAVQFSGPFTLTVNGTGFVPDSQVIWSGHANLSALTASATQLTVLVPDAYIGTVTTDQVGVVSPAPGGGSTGTMPFLVTADVTPPIISALTVTAVSATTATVTWTTNELATSQVFYGLSTSYGSSSVVAATPVTALAVMLTGLSPSTTYHLQASSSDQAGNNAVSSDALFTTSAPGGTGAPATTGGGGGSSCGLGAVTALLSLLACAMHRWLALAGVSRSWTRTRGD